MKWKWDDAANAVTCSSCLVGCNLIFRLWVGIKYFGFSMGLWIFWWCHWCGVYKWYPSFHIIIIIRVNWYTFTCIPLSQFSLGIDWFFFFCFSPPFSWVQKTPTWLFHDEAGKVKKINSNLFCHYSYGSDPERGGYRNRIVHDMPAYCPVPISSLSSMRGGLGILPSTPNSIAFFILIVPPFSWME